MPELDIGALRDHLAGTPVAVVVAERDAPLTDYRGRALDLDEDLQAEFRDRAIQSLAEYEDQLLPVPFAENTLLSEHEFAVADRSLIDPALLAELRRAASVSPMADSPPRPEQLRLFAVVAANAHHDALLIRRQNPVRHLGRDKLTLSLSQSRLTRADPIFVYDANFDLIVFDDVVAIRSQTALEAVFMEDTARQADTERALGAVARFIRPADHASLAETVGRDSLYGAKLRRLMRAGVFDSVDMRAVAQTIDDFNLELRVVDETLVFPQSRTGRWEFLYALEDAFVLGRSTGRRYRANSKRLWERRSITDVTEEAGRIVEVRGPGAWSPRSSEDVVRDIDSRRSLEYVARLADGPARVLVRADQPWVAGETALTNRLLEIAVSDAAVRSEAAPT